MATVPLLAASHSAVTFEDVFTVTAIDAEGKKYDRVSRLQGKSHAFGMDLVLDWNCEIYPLDLHETLSVVLAKSLQKGLLPEEEEEGAAAGKEKEKAAGKDGKKEKKAPSKKEKEAATWRVDGPKGLEEYFDYVMYGKIYRMDEGIGDRVTAYISYGGLLMSLSGSYRNMGTMMVGTYTYLLVRRAVES